MMNYLGKAVLGFGIAVVLAQPLFSRGEAATNATPEFKEVYDLIREHLAGESEADLNRDAVNGLLHQLRSKVSLVGTKSSVVITNAPLLIKSNLFEGTIAYLCIGRVGDGLAEKLADAYQELSKTNPLNGVVLDLRYAGGENYAAAASTADLFTAKEKALLDWGKGIVQSKDKTNAITLPLAILVNQQTAAGAEALAEVLRQNAGAILLGATTAGEATMNREFPLKEGQILRIATAAIKLGNGEVLSAKGIRPDIEVLVKAEDERAFYMDPFRAGGSGLGAIASIVGDRNFGAGGTNRSTRAHQLTEAELMRERKARPGVEVEDLPLIAPASAEAEKPFVHDPVLGRALDLVKGIAAIRQTPAR